MKQEPLAGTQACVLNAELAVYLNIGNNKTMTFFLCQSFAFAFLLKLQIILH